MKPINPIDLGLHDFECNGVKNGAQLKIEVFEDTDCTIEDLCDPVEYPEDAERIRNGDLVAVWLRVTATFGTFKGIDTLGGVLLSNPDDDAEATNHAMENDMHCGALTDLVKSIETQIEFLKLNGLVA